MNERVRVKFCGLTRPEDVQAAVRMGVDYLGFVCVPGSRRCLDLRRASEWLQGLDTGEAKRVGVFQDQAATHINHLVRRLRLDLVQLHGHEPRDFARTLDVPVIVVRRPSARGGAILPLEPNVFAALLDAENEAQQSGGLGLRLEVSEIRRLAASLPPSARVILSGGLNADNVRELVDACRPFAVDVSSGVESAPGIKDPSRMRAFLQALGRFQA